MKKLANDCARSNLTVSPANWKTKRASTSKPWCIRYRFYFRGGYRAITIRNMNQEKDLVKRQETTRGLIEHELDLLDNKAYNPVLKSFIEENEAEVLPATPFVPALYAAYNALSCDKTTLQDIKYALGAMVASTISLPLGLMRIVDIEPRHIFILLKKCEDERKMSPSNYNHYRAYLMMLFKQLFILGAVRSNPVRDIPLKSIPKKQRETLTTEQRRLINQRLHGKNYPYWRYMNIFFHSGGRTTELFTVSVKDVSIERQRYKVWVKKGGRMVEVWKTIKDIALPLWVELIDGARLEDYVFGKGLKAGPVAAKPQMVTRYWQRHVKNYYTMKEHRFTVTADFYSLKHSNTSEMVTALSDRDAAKLNSHTSTAMVVGIYDTQRAEREHERIKGVNNPF